MEKLKNLSVIKQIVFLVAAAQQHSDEGKVLRNERWAMEGWGTSFQPVLQGILPCKQGYPGKDQAITAAIKIIDTHPYMGINYFVKNNGKNSIVYFNFKIDGERYQVSFHTFSYELKKLNGKGSPCRWEKKMGSRETCQILLKKICGREENIINV